MVTVHNIQHEAIFETPEGWYGFRDLEGDGYGQYLFKSHQATRCSPKRFSEWVDPYPFPGLIRTEGFESKEQVISAMLKQVI